MFTLKIKKSYTLTYNRHRCLSGLFQHPRKSELSFLSMNAQVYSQQSPVQCFSDLGAFRTTVEVLPLLLDMKTASWSQCARVAVCVCVLLHACNGQHAQVLRPVTQWVCPAASCHKYDCDLPFSHPHNNSFSICSWLFAVAAWEPGSRSSRLPILL